MQNRLRLSDLYSNRSFRFEIFSLVLFVCILYSASFFFGKVSFIDDAYISFRYAQNLADGHGITWNIQDAPTQGSTTFFFVVLLAGGIKLGLSPETTAFLLNMAGTLIILLTFQSIYHLAFDKKTNWNIIPVLAISFYFPSIDLSTSGMESIFWTGLLCASLLALLFYMEQHRLLFLSLFFFFSFLTCLTRPESPLIIGLWFLYLLWKTSGKERWQAIIGMAVFAMLGLAYVFFLHDYFGNALPNSFYLKVKEGIHFEGISYISGFIFYLLFSPLSVLGILGIVFFTKRHYYLPLPIYAFYILILFYLFTNPMMGNAFRFIHPAAILSVFLLAQGSLFHFMLFWKLLKPHLQRSNNAFRGLIMLILFSIALPLFFISFINNGAALVYKQIFTPEKINDYQYDQAMHNTANALAAIPAIRDIRIIYGDSGLIAYETMAYYIDPVGLNTSEIAHHGREMGPLGVVNYLLNQEADLIAFYTHNDGSVFNAGHGVVGTAYGDLYLNPRFQENYIEVGAIDYGWAINRWFVAKDSDHFAAISAAFTEISMENPPAIHTRLD